MSRPLRRGKKLRLTDTSALSWNTVRTVSHSGLKALERQENEASTFHAKRAACALALRTGRVAAMPASLKRRDVLCSERLVLIQKYVFKSFLGHAHAGLYRLVLSSDYALHDEPFEHAHGNFILAAKCKY